MPKRQTNKNLTGREYEFAVNYVLADMAGNGTQCAILAGYSAKTARITASQLLARPNVAAAIHKLREKRVKTLVLTADARDQLLSKIAEDPSHPVQARISAVKELNKVDGRHSIKHIHEGTLTLEQVLEETAREREAEER